MSKFIKISPTTTRNHITPPSIQVPALGCKKVSNEKSGVSPFRGSEFDSSAYNRSIISDWQLSRSKTDRDLPQKEQIFKDVREIFQTCRGQRTQRKKLSTDSRLNMNRDQQQALYLSPELRQFCKDHKLREKRVQIQYASTLKKIKQKGKQFGCHVRAKSQGIELELIKDKEQKIRDTFNHTFGKDFNRFFKKKLVKEANKCRQNVISMNVAVDTHCQDMLDSLKINERQGKYKKYDRKRLQVYMNSKATQKKSYPLYIKTQLDEKMAQIKKKQQAMEVSLESDSPSSSPRALSPELSKKHSASESSSGLNSARPTSSSKKTISPSRFKQYEDDIVEFMEICHFFEKVQHEILRYLPNNHLSNKVQHLISQVQHSDYISKIYRKCNIDISYFNPIRIVDILQKSPGLLGNMNYIVSIIKLNISAQRRKRFKDTEANIEMYQNLIRKVNTEVCNKLKNTTDPELKKSLWKSLQTAKLDTLATNKVYRDFAKNHEYELTPEALPNRKIICQILKYQTMLK